MKPHIEEALLSLRLADRDINMKDEKNQNADLVSKADAAFLQAAKQVIQVAKQTGTPIVVWEEGRLKEIPADQVELAKIEREIEHPGIDPKAPSPRRVP